MKISHALEGFCLSKRLDFSAATVRNYERVFHEFLAHLGNREMDAITSDDIRRYLDYLNKRRKLSKRSVNSHWAILSSLWSWAEWELQIPHIIRGSIPASSYRKRAIIPFTQDEIKLLLDASAYNKPWRSRNGSQVRSKRPTAVRDKAILLTLLDTGVRASELCALILQDYDTKRGRLRVQHGKGDKERFVMVGTRTGKALWHYLSTRPDTKPTEPLLRDARPKTISSRKPTQFGGTPGEQAGVSNVHTHRFRHTFAIQFLRNGGNVLMLKELMGHEKLEMLLVYVQLAEQDLDGSTKHSPADNWKLGG